MLRHLDKILTKLIDWLYLKRTVLRLKMQAQGMEGDGISKYHYPVNPELIDKHLKEWGLSVAELSKTSAMHRAHSIDAGIKG